MIKAYQLITGDDGHSHIITGYVAENVISKATSIHFKETVAGTYYDWHPAPKTQFVLTLTGTLEFTVFSGEKFTLKAGEVLIAMDTTGSGHTWQMLGNEPWKRAYVVFEEIGSIAFVKDI
jgi:quercetin dioxygenase-like cupin family protein